MTSYYICPVCREPFEVEKYKAHFKTHREIKDKADFELKHILDEAQRSFLKKKNADPNTNAITLFFEIARRVFSETEKVDTSSWGYIFDYEIPHTMSDIHVRIPSPYPAVMCHIKFRVKDKEKFDALLKKHRGTEEERLLKEMVTEDMPIVVVFGKEWGRLYFQWTSEGKSSSDVLMLTVFFFLHEMYHIIGFGEKDSTINASVAMYRFFGQNVGIPEHEIQRWKFEERMDKNVE